MAEVFEVMLRGGVRGSDVQYLTIFHLSDFIANFHQRLRADQTDSIQFFFADLSRHDETSFPSRDNVVLVAEAKNRIIFII